MFTNQINDEIFFWLLAGKMKLNHTNCIFRTRTTNLMVWITHEFTLFRMKFDVYVFALVFLFLLNFSNRSSMAN